MSTSIKAPRWSEHTTKLKGRKPRNARWREQQRECMWNIVQSIVAATAGSDFAVSSVVAGDRVHKTKFRNHRVHARCVVPKVFVQVSHDDEFIACSLKGGQEGVEVIAEGLSRIRVRVVSSSEQIPLLHVGSFGAGGGDRLFADLADGHNSDSSAILAVESNVAPAS
jgi:hypothetical protein